MNATIDRFNRLVEEFDEQTNYRFDQITDTDDLVLIASLWPKCRDGLAAELVMASDEAKQKHLPNPELNHCQTCGEVCPKGWRLCPECHTKERTREASDFDRAFDMLRGKEPRDTGRDDWRADR